MAGNNVTLRIWRMSNIADDSIGGARVSGTVRYERIPASFQEREPSTLLIEQGIEVTKLYDIVVRSASLDIQERDEIEIEYPRDHLYYGDRFRVIGARQVGNFRNPNGFRKLLCVRSERSHGVQ